MLYPFIFVKHPAASPQLTAHELEHVLQMRRDGVVWFYTKYLWFYFVNLRKYKNSHIAYLNIPYEIEARAAENRPEEQPANRA